MEQALLLRPAAIRRGVSAALFDLDSDEVDLESRSSSLFDGAVDVATGVVFAVSQNNHDLAQAFSASLFLLLREIKSGEDPFANGRLRLHFHT